MFEGDIIKTIESIHAMALAGYNPGTPFYINIDNVFNLKITILGTDISVSVNYEKASPGKHKLLMLCEIVDDNGYSILAHIRKAIDEHVENAKSNIDELKTYKQRFFYN